MNHFADNIPLNLAQIVSLFLDSDDQDALRPEAVVNISGYPIRRDINLLTNAKRISNRSMEFHRNAGIVRLHICRSGYDTRFVESLPRIDEMTIAIRPGETHFLSTITRVAKKLTMPLFNGLCADELSPSLTHLSMPKYREP